MAETIFDAVAGSVHDFHSKKILSFTDSTIANAEAQMENDSIAMIRSWAWQSDFPGSGTGNWQVVIFKGEGSRFMRFCSNGNSLWVKIGPASYSWHALF